MTPLTGFEDEVFISYAHVGNHPLDEGLKGWVETPHERLQIRLTQLTGEPVKIWRDRKLQGNDIFADTLVTRACGRATTDRRVRKRHGSLRGQPPLFSLS
ncbi:MAG TPA: hypothetical protein VGV38_01880 [Pyrinomonadaceae bacterium]|nr:hypothetical protein [Pyrinomonadaceae bacterium]